MIRELMVIGWRCSVSRLVLASLLPPYPDLALRVAEARGLMTTDALLQELAHG